MKKNCTRLLQAICALLLLFSVQANAQSPTAPALGFNVFLQKGATLYSNETEGPVAMGGDLTLAQNGSYQVSTNYTGSFKVNNVAVTLVIGGKVNYNGGNGVTINQNGYVKIGNGGNSKVWYKDQNNAYSPIRITPGSDYNGSPRINLQANSQQLGVSDVNNPVFQANVIDFNTAFTQMKATSASIAQCTDNTNLTNANGTTIPHTNLPNQVKLNLHTGINTLNLTGADMNVVTDFIYNNKPDANHILVVNVNAPGSFTWKVYNSGGIGFQDCPYILYNFYNTTTLNIEGGGAVEGTVFAPFADIVKTVNQANIEGQIIAQSYIQNGGENHYPVFTSTVTGCATVCNLSVSGTKTDITCNGAVNGAINITASGNNGAVSYLWNDGITTEDRTNLSAGDYSVQVSDAAGCKVTSQAFTINQPAAISITGVTVDVTAVNGNNGSINVTVTGGTGNYSYKWNDGVTTKDRTNLTAGTYTLTVTDANGCSADKAIVIHQPGDCTGFRTQTQGGWGATAKGNNPASYRDANFAGAFPNGVTIGCSGNTLTLTTAAAVEAFLPSGSTPSVLPAGKLKDPGESYSNVLAAQLVTAVLNVGFDAYDASFSSNAIHTGDLVITTGTFAGKTINQLIAEANAVIGGCATTHTPSELNAALTSFNETYDNGTTDNGYTSCAPACNLSVSGTKTDITCNSADNGAINITASGNNGTVSYLWNDGITTEDRTDLPMGNYSVQVSDAAGCKVTSQTFTINQPAAINISGITVDVTTVNGNNGSINITVTGGSGNYSYKWSDGATTEDRTGLSKGDYAVTVTDANGCSESKVFTINQPGCNISVSGKATAIKCYGSNSGSIDITVSGNNGNVTYLWNDGITTEDRTGLSTGNYTVQVSDAVGCDATSETYTITEPASAVAVDGVSTDVTTVNGTDGTINITVTGGTGNYSYKWNDGVTTEDRTGLSKGNYSVVVTDANGCSETRAFVINQPGCAITLSGKIKPVTCFGGNNGSIDLTVKGATGTVSYLWNDGITTEDRQNLSAGKYSVKVTDSKGCSVTSPNVAVKQPKKIKVSSVATGQKTKEVCDGTVQLSATGGTAPYKFIWSDGYVGASRTGLCMATYTITVQDKKGCTCTYKFRVPCEDTTIVKGGAKQTTGASAAIATGLHTTASVAPNPAKDVVRVTVNAANAGPATITVYNLTGKALLQNKINLNKGYNQQQLNLGSFAKGLYYIHVVTDNGSEVFKVTLN